MSDIEIPTAEDDQKYLDDQNLKNQTKEWLIETYRSTYMAMGRYSRGPAMESYRLALEETIRLNEVIAKLKAAQSPE